MHTLAIVALCVGAAVIYGVLHDQVTARICVEYFTIGHPPIFGTDSPTLLGIGWGIVATWWAGLGVGVPLAIAARAGGRPKRDARSLVRPVLMLLCVMAAAATLMGCVGFVLANRGIDLLFGSVYDQIPLDRHAAFQADGFAHATSYHVGFVGSLVVAIRVWRSRSRNPQN